MKQLLCLDDVAPLHIRDFRGHLVEYSGQRNIADFLVDNNRDSRKIALTLKSEIHHQGAQSRYIATVIH